MSPPRPVRAWSTSAGIERLPEPVPTIRFAVKAPLSPNFSLSSVPADFQRYVWDIDTDQPDGTERAGRMRYLGTAYGVMELGPIDDVSGGGIR